MNSQESVKLEVNLSNSSTLCAWIPQSGTLRIAINKEERKNSGGINLLRKNQVTLSQEELLAITRVLPIIDQLTWFTQFQRLHDGPEAYEKIVTGKNGVSQTSPITKETGGGRN